MNLMTVDEIVEILNTGGIFITKEKFNYYVKVGLLFPSDKKIKKRVKQGIISFYAYENIKIIKDIIEFKKEGLSLNEIRGLLLSENKKKIRELYDEVEIDLSSLIKAQGIIIFNNPVEEAAHSWRKKGYYRGLLEIYTEFARSLQKEIDAAESQFQYGEALCNKIIGQVEDSDDKILIGRIMKEESSRKDKIYKKLHKHISKFISEKYDPLANFVFEHNLK